MLGFAARLSRSIGFRWGEAFSLYLMGNAALLRGDLEGVEGFCAQSLQLFRVIGERLGLAYTLNELGRNSLVKEVAHGVYEDQSGPLPFQRLREAGRP